MIALLLGLAVSNVISLLTNQRSEDSVRHGATPRLLDTQQLELSLAELNSAQNLAAVDPAMRSEFDRWRERSEQAIQRVHETADDAHDQRDLAALKRDLALFRRVDRRAQQALATGHPRLARHLVVDTDTRIYSRMRVVAQDLVANAQRERDAAVADVSRTREITLGAGVLLGLLALSLIGWLLIAYSRQRRAFHATAAGYRALVEQIPAAVYTVSPDGAPEYVSPQITDILGYTPGEWLQLYRRGGFWLDVHPDDQPVVDEITRRLEEGRADTFEVEFRAKHKDGSYRDLVLASGPIGDEVNGRTGRQGVILDRTATREMEARYLRVAKQLPAAIVIWDIRRREILDATDQLEVLTGEPVAVWIGPSGFTEWTSRIVEETASVTEWRERAVRGETWTNEYQWRRPDGRVLWVWTINAAVPDHPGRVQSIFYDITREVETRSELHDAERRRRVAIEQLISTAEAEQARIAAELHDDTVQVMVAALMRLGMTDDPMARSAAELLQLAIDRTRTMMFELRPQILERNGLGDAIRELANEGPWKARVDIRVGRHSEITETLCYRTVRELIVNARKHSHAGTLSVSGRETDDGWLLFTVEDDGVGFDMASELSKPTAKYHIGLDSTMERVDLAGGSLEIESAPGAGTRCVLRLPFEPVSSASPSRAVRAEPGR
ncbi:MAG: PAS domain-containing sensor histidine kinase [Gaiellales bacterium]